MIWVMLVVVVVVLWFRRRAARKRMLSGLEGTRPVFSVEPPTRRMGSRRTESL